MFDKLWLFIKNRWKQAQLKSNLQKSKKYEQPLQDNKGIKYANPSVIQARSQPIKQQPYHKVKTVQNSLVKVRPIVPVKSPVKKIKKTGASVKKITNKDKKIEDQKRLEKILLEYQNRYAVKGLEENHIKILYSMARYDYKRATELKKSVKYSSQNPEHILENDLAKLVSSNLISEERKLGKKNQPVSIEFSLTEMGKSLVEEIYPEIVEIKKKISEQAEIQERAQTISFSDNDLIDILDSEE